MTASQAAKTAVKMSSSYIPYTDGNKTITEMYSVNESIVHKVVFNKVGKKLINNYRKSFGVDNAKLFIELQSKSQGMSAAADMCISDGGFKEALDLGVYMIYRYYDNDLNLLYQYGFNKKVCPSIERDYRAINREIDKMWDSRNWLQ